MTAPGSVDLETWFSGRIKTRPLKPSHPSPLPIPLSLWALLPCFSLCHISSSAPVSLGLSLAGPLCHHLDLGCRYNFSPSVTDSPSGTEDSGGLLTPISRVVFPSHLPSLCPLLPSSFRLCPPPAHRVLLRAGLPVPCRRGWPGPRGPSVACNLAPRWHCLHSEGQAALCA